MATTTTNAVRAAPTTRVVALDIGTHGSGFASAERGGSGAILQLEQWPDAPSPYPKARSALLYRGRQPVAWGWTAHRELAAMSADDRQQHWLLEDFKLALQDPEAAAHLKSKGLTAEQVMVDFLTLFGRFVKEQLQREGVPARELNNVQWCLTVPAMWTEASKQSMRKAAFKAGLIRNVDSDALAIILEPEAAALHALATKAPPLRRGMTMCVIDVGGGTCDITAYDVEEQGRRPVLAEAVAAEGVLAGGAHVDQAFDALYRDRVGPATVDLWREAYQAEYLQVMKRWTHIKHAWTGTAAAAAAAPAGPGGRGEDEDEEDEDVLEEIGHEDRVFIPPELHRMMTPADKERLRMEQQGHDSDVYLAASDMQALFQPTVTAIVAQAKKVLREMSAKSGCDVAILVGGFASSPYLEAAMRSALAPGPRGLARTLVVPPHPYASVLQGAVSFGLDPFQIRARCMPVAVGIQHAVPFVDGAPLHSKFFLREESCFYSSVGYARLVNKGQQVGAEEEVSVELVPVHRHQRTACIKLFVTDNDSINFVDPDNPDLRLLGELELDLEGGGDEDDGEEPDDDDDDAAAAAALGGQAGTSTGLGSDESHDPDGPRLIEFTIKFGATELKARAVDLSTGREERVRLRFVVSS